MAGVAREWERLVDEPERQEMQHLVLSTQWIFSESFLSQTEKSPRVNFPERIASGTQSAASSLLP